MRNITITNEVNDRETVAGMVAGKGNSAEVKVWDPLVRVFHWSLVVSFIVAYLSGDESSDLHIYSGYIIAGLIIFRVLWGFVGSEHARFSDFVRSPRTVIDYIKTLPSGRVRRYLGHNPAGGAMTLALLLSLTITVYSGLKVYAIEEGAGPLANVSDISFIRSAHADDDGHDSEEDFWEEFWEEIHEASANFVLLLVALHIAGVIFSGRLHKENLAIAMITGNKRIE